MGNTAQDRDMTTKSEAAWSFLVDDTPSIWSCVIPWLATAIKLARIPPARIHVHHVCALNPQIAELCRALAVNTHKVEPFDPRYPHTNKIQQCATDFGDTARVVLTDADIVFARRPPLENIHAPVAGKLVDLPNPPMNMLRDVFAASGVPAPDICSTAYVDRQNTRVAFDTYPGNYNGGLYVIDRDHLGRIGQAWAKWAHWLIERTELLGRWATHIDQVSFCLAVNELRIDLGLLDDTWNFPCHLNGSLSDREPFILHHHAAFDLHQLLKPISAPRAQAAIKRVNEAIESCRHWGGNSTEAR